MKLFMGNPCGYGNCMRTDCEKCYHYTPTIFNVKVPKWLGNIGFWFEWQMFKISKKKAIKGMAKIYRNLPHCGAKMDKKDGE